ncbi:hypothetical protein PVK06_008029 [Gossypium arboreum]|uniref:Uncharacterized protein n=1 Tax=Gossypium arboreum TaxID=29729 RepID=A0ABR0QJW2_GOSAR|nr:hypothetical protein PVK06_008029 [Gossypium arboreum]
METPTNSIDLHSKALVQTQSSIQNSVLPVVAAVSHNVKPELQLIIHETLTEGMIISESFQVTTIIKKSPPAWNDFKNYLKHKMKEMSVKDLIIRLQIEEDKKGTEKMLNKLENVNSARANIVEVKDLKKGKQPQNGSKLGPKGGTSKK